MAEPVEHRGSTLASTCYRELFETLPDMAIMTTPSGDLLDINRLGVTHLGYRDKAEILSIPVDRHYADSADRCRLASLLKDRGAVEDFETRLVRKDGTVMNVWITARARQDGNRHVLYHEKIIRNTLSPKNLRRELIARNRSLEKTVQDLQKERDHIEAQADSLMKAVAELNEAKRIVEEQNQKITAELDMAAKLQQSLLPKRYPKIEGYRFASKYLPSNRIGGDFFDIIELENGNVGVVIADVSGHGPAAALLTTMFKMSFHLYAQESLSPSDVLGRLNSEFCRLITTGEYITAFYLVLRPDEKRIVYSKAGHPYPILFRKATGTHQRLDAEGFFIGMFDEAVFENMEVSLEDGDRLLLYTDGVIEARDPSGTCFELKHLEHILADQNDLPCHVLLEEIYARLSRFTQRDRFEDDLCMVLVSAEP